MREKRLGQEQDHQQKTQPKKSLAGEVQAADLKGPFELGNRGSEEMRDAGQQKAAEDVQKPFQRNRKLGRFESSFQGKVKERFQEAGAQRLSPWPRNIQPFVAP